MPPETETEDLIVVEDDAEAAALLDGDDDDGGGGETQDSDEAIRIATMFGWKPKDQWKGDTSKWTPAGAYLATYSNSLTDTRKKLDRTEGKLADIVAQVAKLDGAQTRREAADLNAELEEAVNSGDIAAAQKVLERAKSSAAPVGDARAAVADFQSRNASWLEVDEVASAYAERLDAKFALEVGGKENIRDVEAHLKRVEAGVKAKFPALFGEGEKAKDEDKGERRRAPLVQRGGRAERPGGSEVTVASMTQPMREAAKRMGVSPESYVKSWNTLNKKGAA